MTEQAFCSTDEFGNVWRWVDGRATFVRGPRRSEQAFRAVLHEIIRQCSYLPLRGHDPVLSAARREIETAASSALRALDHEETVALR